MSKTATTDKQETGMSENTDWTERLKKEAEEMEKRQPYHCKDANIESVARTIHCDLLRILKYCDKENYELMHLNMPYLRADVELMAMLTERLIKNEDRQRQVNPEPMRFIRELVESCNYGTEKLSPSFRERAEKIIGKAGETEK